MMRILATLERVYKARFSCRRARTLPESPAVQPPPLLHPCPLRPNTGGSHARARTRLVPRAMAARGIAASAAVRLSSRGSMCSDQDRSMNPSMGSREGCAELGLMTYERAGSAGRAPCHHGGVRAHPSTLSAWFPSEREIATLPTRGTPSDTSTRT